MCVISKPDFFRCDVCSGKGIRQNRGDNLYPIEKRPEVCSFFGPQTSLTDPVKEKKRTKNVLMDSETVLDLRNITNFKKYYRI